MASLVKTRSSALCSRIWALSRPLTSSVSLRAAADQDGEIVTHTGQAYKVDDYRRARFVDGEKLVNASFAVDLIADDPVVVCAKRVVWSNSGGALGHPKVFINLDGEGVHTCGYSGRKFVHEKNYNAATMGTSITYEEYLQQMKSGQF